MNVLIAVPKSPVKSYLNHVLRAHEFIGASFALRGVGFQDIARSRLGLARRLRLKFNIEARLP